MPKKRIYQVAKDFNISSEALLEMIHAAGVDAKSHMSAVDDEVIAQIRKKFDAEKEAVKEEEARKHKIQEDTRRAPAPHPHPYRPPQPGGGSLARPGGGGGGGGLQARIIKKKKRIDEKAVLESVKKTLADLELGKKKKRKKRIRATGEVAEENPHLLRVSEFIAVAELAALMDVSPSQVIGKALAGGLMVTINQRLEKDTVVLLADEFGYQIEFLTDAEEILEDEDEGEEEAVETSGGALEPRAPIVTVMGHWLWSPRRSAPRRSVGRVSAGRSPIRRRRRRSRSAPPPGVRTTPCAGCPGTRARSRSPPRSAARWSASPSPWCPPPGCCAWGTGFG